MTTRGEPLDVTLSVSDSAVRLAGAGVDVTADHGGVRPGLRNALHDVRLERTRQTGLPSRPRDSGAAVRDLSPEVSDRPGLVSLRRAGQLLAESFLPAPVSQALRSLVERAVAGHAALRIGIDAPDLAGLPWEALPEPVSGLPLALHPQVTVLRRSASSEPARLPGPLRIVVAIASPETGGGPLLDYEQELRAVLAAVRPARRSQAQVEVVPFATTRAIRAALDGPGGVHVLHISAHGKPGALLLEDEDGAAREVTADELVEEAIPPGRMPPVLALAACYTDVAGEEQGSSFAARLAARGACAVIGTQTSVTDRYATLLFAKVYAELAASRDPDVVRALTDARRLVQRELLQAPSPAARALAGMDEWGVVTLLANAPALPVIDHRAPPVVVSAPRTAQWGPVAARPVGQFVGRRSLQRRLPSVLGGDEYAGLVLHGIGGVGKTTLAAEILRRTVEADPQWRVATLFGAITADQVLAEVAAVARRELVVRETVAGPATVAVRAATRVDLPLADRFALLREHLLDEVPVLLVLDNFEDNLTAGEIIDAGLAELLAAWASAPARSRLLITCRHPVPLGGLLAVPVGPLTAAETGKLLWSLPHIDRCVETDTVGERIWRAVGGHPRSLEYLDALLGQGQGRFDDITDRLIDAASARLGTDRSAAWLAQDRTLDAAVADTVTLAADDILLTEHLNRLATIPGAMEVLMAISVYREPIPAMALSFHVGVPRPEDETPQQETTADNITTLLARNQLTIDQLDIALAEDSPLKAGERDTLQHLLSEFLQPPRPPYTEPAALAALLQNLVGTSLVHHDTDHDLVFMHRWTATELHDRWRPTATLDPGKGPLRRAHHTAAEYWQWHVQFWPQNRDANLHDRFEARHHLLAAGDLDAAGAVTESICARLQDTGAWDQAASLIDETLRWLPTASARRPVYIHTLGVLAHRRGDLAEAERRFQQSIAINEQLGNQARLADSYGELGNLAYSRGDDAEAERRYQQALSIAQQLGDQNGIAFGHHQLGMLAHRQGDYAGAEHRYRQCISIKEQLDDLIGLARSYHQLGLLAHDQGDYGMAEQHYERALSINQRIGNRAGLAYNLGQLGNLAHNRGDYAETEARYQQALSIHQQLGDQAGIAIAYHQLGLLAQRRGDYAEAEHRCQQSLSIERQLGNQVGIATSLSQLANLRVVSGHNDSAVPLHIEALAIRLAVGVPQVAYDIGRLVQIRDEIGRAAFADAAKAVLDGESYDNLVAMLDRASLAD
ncbi:tetratricopeptide repeat protein [Dactylosporangium sp. NPDC051541]|uniref:tetratricopeptide repeat protein n=1 Tax=Dactylosporangium sp. NPDC051541 TaxID=3363977 RepID=UPI0037944B00